MPRPRQSRPSLDDLEQWAADGEKLDGMPIPAARNGHDHAAYVKLDPAIADSLAVNIDRDWIEQLESAIGKSELAGMFPSRAALMRACIWIGAARLLNECDPRDTWMLRLRYIESERQAERERAKQRREYRDIEDPRIIALMAEYDVLFGEGESS